MAKTHVAVLMGGVSSEHDISVKSGAMVAGSLDRDRYHVEPIVISREGMWKLPGERSVPLLDALTLLKGMQVDCVFIALHGPYGEDGRMQGLFDLIGMPYVGSGPAASALALDKIRTKAVLRDGGLLTPEDFVIERRRWDADPARVTAALKKALGFPCVIKSPCQGSSLGMALVQSEPALRKALHEVMAYGDTVLAERMLGGTEVTCGVIDAEPDGEPQALPVTEIRPVESSFFDYHAKYTPGACEEITPAEIDEAETRAVQEAAVKAHRLLGCRGMSRVDFFMEEDGPYVIEVNTIPGMTETSLLPQAAAEAGISFSELLTRLIEGALARAKRDAGDR